MELRNDENRQAVITYLDEVIKFYKGMPDEEDQVNAYINLKDNIERELFSIVLVGEFSNGKSTFLNALMRKRILPSFSSETTATINFLRHKNEAPNGEKGLVYFYNGEKEVLEDLSVATISDVVSVKGGEKVQKEIKNVDLFLDSEFLEKGVMLVDSPGLNGMDPVRSLLTQNQIKESHACIFIFNAEKPGTGTDFQFLKELKNECSNIIFVLNKIDTIHADEGETVESVITVLKESYKKVFPDDNMIPKIWPVSAYAALVGRDDSIEKYMNEEIKSVTRRNELLSLSRMQEFEDYLLTYLSKGERAYQQLNAPMENMIKQLAQTRANLYEELEILKGKQNSEELEAQKLVIEEEIRNLENTRDAKLLPVRKEINSILSTITTSAVNKTNKIKEEILEDIGVLSNIDEIEVFSDNFDKYINTKLLKLSRRIDDEVNDKFFELINDQLEDYYNNLEIALETREKINLQLEGDKFKLTEIVTNNQLEKFDKELGNLIKKSECLETELKNISKDSFDAKLKALEYENLVQEIKKVRDEKNEVERQFTPPVYIDTYQDVTEFQDRTGCLGKIAQIFLGQKKVSISKKIDYKEQIEQANKRHKDIIDSYEKQIKELEAQRKAISGNGYKAECLDAEISSKERDIKRINNQIENMMKKKEEEIRANHNKVILRYTNSMKTYLNEKLDMSEDSIRTELNKTRKFLVEAVNTFVSDSIGRELENRKKTLDKLRAMLNEEDAEKEARIKFIEEANSAIEKLMNSGLEIKSQLATDMNRKVEQESL